MELYFNNFVTMREIKFKYIYSDWKDILTNVFSLDEIANWDHFEYICNSPFLKEYRIIDRLQYTWLQDKNWKEIFDWDITNIWEVVWVDMCAWFRINPSRKNTDTAFTESFMNYDNIEVIGNIFENWDLLTNK